MNKKEQAAFDAMRLELAVSKALRWPDYTPTRLIPSEVRQGVPYGEVTPAWTFNAYTMRVSHGCFSHSYHSPDRTDKTTTQEVGGPWYSSKREALQALRVAKTAEFAKALANLDLLIEQEASR